MVLPGVAKSPPRSVHLCVPSSSWISAIWQDRGEAFICVSLTRSEVSTSQPVQGPVAAVNGVLASLAHSEGVAGALPCSQTLSTQRRWPLQAAAILPRCLPAVPQAVMSHCRLLRQASAFTLLPALRRGESLGLLLVLEWLSDPPGIDLGVPSDVWACLTCPTWPSLMQLNLPVRLDLYADFKNPFHWFICDHMPAAPSCTGPPVPCYFNYQGFMFYHI